MHGLLQSTTHFPALRWTCLSTFFKTIVMHDTIKLSRSLQKWSTLAVSGQCARPPSWQASRQASVCRQVQRLAKRKRQLGAAVTCQVHTCSQCVTQSQRLAVFVQQNQTCWAERLRCKLLSHQPSSWKTAMLWLASPCTNVCPACACFLSPTIFFDACIVSVDNAAKAQVSKYVLSRWSALAEKHGEQLAVIDPHRKPSAKLTYRHARTAPPVCLQLCYRG